MSTIISYIVAGGSSIIENTKGYLSDVVSSTTSTMEEMTTEGQLDQIFNSTRKASEWSYNLMNVIYILIAMVIVVAIFTVTLYVYKFFMNRKDPNYKKNDDTFLDD